MIDFPTLSLTSTSEFPTLSFNSLRTADVSPRSSPLKDVSRGGTSATQRQNSKLMTQNLPGIRSEAPIGGRIVVLATGFIM